MLKNIKIGNSLTLGFTSILMLLITTTAVSVMRVNELNGLSLTKDHTVEGKYSLRRE